MDAQDRQAIDDIFRRLEDVERQGAPRDAQAEALITERVMQRPAYAYYLAQTVVAQQQGLEAAQARLDALEGRGRAAPAREEGGFLSRIFGGGEQPRTAVPPTNPARDPRSDRRPGMGGGGFLAGAAQTAVGVAGGVILGNMLMNAFDGNGGEAQAAEPDAGAADQTGGGEDVGVEADASAGDADVGGDFDVGGFEF